MEGDAVLVFDDDVVVEAEKVMATCSNAKLRFDPCKCRLNVVVFIMFTDEKYANA